MSPGFPSSANSLATQLVTYPEDTSLLPHSLPGVIGHSGTSTPRSMGLDRTLTVSPSVFLRVLSDLSVYHPGPALPHLMGPSGLGAALGS